MAFGRGCRVIAERVHADKEAIRNYEFQKSGGHRAQHSRPFCGLFHELLVGQVIEGAHVTNLATIDDEAEYFGFAQRRHRHCRAVLRFLRNLTRALQFGQ